MNDIILEDQTLDEISLTGVSTNQGGGSVPLGVVGKVKNFIARQNVFQPNQQSRAIGKRKIGWLANEWNKQYQTWLGQTAQQSATLGNFIEWMKIAKLPMTDQVATEIQQARDRGQDAAAKTKSAPSNDADKIPERGIEPDEVKEAAKGSLKKEREPYQPGRFTNNQKQQNIAPGAFNAANTTPVGANANFSTKPTTTAGSTTTPTAGGSALPANSYGTGVQSAGTTSQMSTKPTFEPGAKDTATVGNQYVKDEDIKLNNDTISSIITSAAVLAIKNSEITGQPSNTAASGDTSKRSSVTGSRRSSSAFGSPSLTVDNVAAWYAKQDRRGREQVRDKLDQIDKETTVRETVEKIKSNPSYSRFLDMDL
jgi:hypothetical protein